MKPSGMDEQPEQYRPPIIKAEGVTESERYLAKLANKSFLNLWSYPNTFRDQKQSGKGDGKEICDLLVVCDKHILIFSEKTIAWTDGDLKCSLAPLGQTGNSRRLKTNKGGRALAHLSIQSVFF